MGPTAVGKTALALALAERWSLDVVSADSRQVYTGLDIATAKPTPRERQRVPHHMLDVVAPGERYSAGRYALEAGPVLASIGAAGRMPVVVGGTGLYIRALTDGLFVEPTMDAPAREGLAGITAGMDHASLVRWASRLDRRFGGTGGRHRAQRAIEIALLTGQPLSWWQRTAATHGVIDPWVVRLTVPRAVLHRRIRQRTEEMITRGLVEEVEAAIADGAPVTGPGMDGIGVREAVQVLQGTLPREQLADAVLIATRQYAKRQETWFRHQLDPALTLDATRAPAHLADAVITAWEQRIT
ncbi:MAG: tRNA (adenosine(37)-N6)-dimethylallyltransferase MiaA [Gemmatimonadales bacterium]|nr:tRNA (adenosine(37)-N6)-dimethylallyltransferase MiaA [Gemmatimonadales bacterium]